METIEITSMSSKGQIVIPQSLRYKLGVSEGEKFIILGEKDTIILKKIKKPDFDKILNRTRAIVKEKKINKKNLEKAIKRVRNKKE
jgi:AbrB family looped-hinge helix DNA binding protein